MLKQNRKNEKKDTLSINHTTNLSGDKRVRRNQKISSFSTITQSVPMSPINKSKRPLHLTLEHRPHVSNLVSVILLCNGSDEIKSILALSLPLPPHPSSNFRTLCTDLSISPNKSFLKSSRHLLITLTASLLLCPQLVPLQHFSHKPMSHYIFLTIKPM